MGESSQADAGGIYSSPKDGGPGRHTAWLATVHPDGRPHVMPIGVLLVDDAFYFNTGPKTRKARNIARNPSSVITIATDDFDIVVQGPAKRITDPSRLQRIADAFKKEGWEPTVVKGGLTAKYSAPSAGPPPWNVYEIRRRRSSPWVPPSPMARRGGNSRPTLVEIDPQPV